MDQPDADIGMIGLGTMGRNLLLNMADHGYSIAGYDNKPDKVAALLKEGTGKRVFGANDLGQFVATLRVPRSVILLVPAGPPVDEVIQGLLPLLSPGDIIIDGGNSYFKDTDRRGKELTSRGFGFMGVGISGGEYGARHGPSIMPGGPRQSYERVQPILEAVAAKAHGEPCVTYLGPGSAGHYVKMVHNGIEYGFMEMIAESYDLMKRGLGFDNDQLHTIYARWNQEELNSYLIEITSQIFLQRDPAAGGRLVDLILDKARQKGTGAWTSEEAMRLEVPAPTIDVAVAMRNLSAIKEEREAASRLLRGPSPSLNVDRDAFIDQLRNALYAGMVTVFAQGMSLLAVASRTYGYGLSLEEVARIWRAGCIIRAALLEDVRAAFRTKPDLPNLLLDPRLEGEVERRQGDLRKVIAAAVEAGIPVPALMVSLSYVDGYRSPRLPSNLIQAQRDYFGAHTYERVDREGIFHTEW